MNKHFAPTHLPIEAKINVLPPIKAGSLDSIAPLKHRSPGYFRAKLLSVPRVGDFIELYSYVEQMKKEKGFYYFEVVAVVHEIQDVSEEVELSLKGHHAVSVFVKQSQSKWFVR